MKRIKIYTDGSSLGNPGRGGWGAILIYNNYEKKISGSQENVTNNQMELMAAINAISSVKLKCEIDIFTDSTYVQKGISQWIKSWVQNGWKNSSKKVIKNVELWKTLYDLTKKHKVNWHWVKGHSGNKYNEIADNLAREAAENI